MRVTLVCEPDDAEPLLLAGTESDLGRADLFDPPCGADRGPPELSPPLDRDPEPPDDELEEEEPEPPRDLAWAHEGVGRASEKATRETPASEIQRVMAALRGM